MVCLKFKNTIFIHFFVENCIIMIIELVINFIVKCPDIVFYKKNMEKYHFNYKLQTK